MDPRQAASEIAEIQFRLSNTQTFRGYRSLTVGTIGAIAVLLTTPAIPPATKYSCALPEPPMRRVDDAVRIDPV